VGEGVKTKVLIAGHGILKLIPIPEERLRELEAKVQELERREKGVMVITREYSSGESYDFCGNCEVVICGEEVYCPTCGTKLIWESECE
jgi:hypothetical protein